MANIYVNLLCVVQSDGDKIVVSVIPVEIEPLGLEWWLMLIITGFYKWRQKITNSRTD